MDVGHDSAMHVRRPEGLERVYREQAERLWRSMLAFSGDPEIASDAVAEAFAQALARGDALHQPDRWVWKAAYRIAAGALKERGRIIATERTGAYDLPENAVAMAGMLRRLPTRQRAAVILHYYADLPNDRIAEVLGISRATVRVHLSQGRKRLRELWQEGPHV
jgi:RNA polymerase sigma-70 factor, ECF subfamily